MLSLFALVFPQILLQMVILVVPGLPALTVRLVCGQSGISEVKVEETADGHILHLQAEDALIQLEEDATHIVCDNNEPLRTALRDLVLRFLQKL